MVIQPLYFSESLCSRSRSSTPLQMNGVLIERGPRPFHPFCQPNAYVSRAFCMGDAQTLSFDQSLLELHYFSLMLCMCASLSCCWDAWVGACVSRHCPCKAHAEEGQSSASMYSLLKLACVAAMVK